jgi:hypothetical protein
MHTKHVAADSVGQFYRVLNDSDQQKMYEIKQEGQHLIDLIDSLGNSKEIERAKARVEEAVMWAVKHITNS